MTADPDVAGETAVWRCPVCEGVNHGGRVCSTCGERLPEGFTPKDAVGPAPPPEAAQPLPVVPVIQPLRPPSFDDVFGPP